MEDINVESETFQQPPPSVLVNLYDQVTEFLVLYGWYFLFVGLGVLIYWDRICGYLDNRKKVQSEKDYEAKCKKDPDWLQLRQSQMESARRRMQEELDRKAAEHAAKMKEKNEERNKTLLKSTAESGYRLGYGESSNVSETKTSTKKPYRPEYNPLMGSGGSGGYRPPRRGCPGGGCG